MSYGSLENHLYGHCINTKTPEVGDGATAVHYTDREPFTVVEVLSKTAIVLQRDLVLADKTKELGVGHQNWVITPDPEGYTVIATLRKNGKWITKGRGQKSGTRFLIGGRDYYYDWTF